MTNRASLIRGTIESNNAPSTTVRISTIALTMCDVVDAVPDVLIVAGEAVLEVDVKRLFRSIPPWFVIGHAGIAEGNH